MGTPSIDIDEQRDMRLLYDSNGTPRLIEGNGQGLTGAVSLGPPFAGTEPIAASALNPQGGGVAAWPSADTQGNPAVAVLEDFPSGAVQTALVSGGAGGEVGELAVGRSGLGDGLVAFRQGPFGNAAIVVARGQRAAGAVRRDRPQRLDQALPGAAFLAAAPQARTDR